MLSGLNKFTPHPEKPRTLTRGAGFTLIVGCFVFILMLFARMEDARAEDIDVRISNVFNDRFVVSWTTATSKVSSINYGATSSLGNTAYDVRGSAFEGTTHYVLVSGLDFNTTYYFDVVCGGVVYDNGGAHYTVTTGASLDPPAGSDVVYGQVYKSDGTTPAEHAIVYIKLRDNDGTGTSGDSQLWSFLVGSDAYWYIDLRNVRNQALSDYFGYSTSGDSLVLDAVGPDGGVASQVVDTADDGPAPPMILVPNTAPVLEWTNEAGYEADGLSPETGYASTDFEFRIKYIDADGHAPSVYKVYIDKNGDGDYDDAGEANDMTAGGTDFAGGVIYAYTTTVPFFSTSQNCSYYFSFSDGIEFATGNITEAISEGTAINKPDVFQTLGISVDKNSWAIQPVPIEIPALPQVMSQVERITVTNIGDGLQTYTLRIQDEDNKDEWSHNPVEEGNGLNTYVLNAIFCGGVDVVNSSDFNEGASDDVLTTSPQPAGSTKFAYSAGSQSGQSVAPLNDVYLYFRLDLPTKVGGPYFNEEHVITIELGCQEG